MNLDRITAAVAETQVSIQKLLDLHKAALVAEQSALGALAPAAAKVDSLAAEIEAMTATVSAYIAALTPAPAA